MVKDNSTINVPKEKKASLDKTLDTLAKNSIQQTKLLKKQAETLSSIPKEIKNSIQDLKKTTKEATSKNTESFLEIVSENSINKNNDTINNTTLNANIDKLIRQTISKSADIFKRSSPNKMSDSLIKKESRENNLEKNRIALYKAVVSLQTYQKHQAQLDKKLEDDEYQAKRKNTELGHTKSDINNTKGGFALSTGLSLATGGIINPAIINALGLDRLFGGLIKGFFSPITKKLSDAYYGEGKTSSATKNTELSNLDKNVQTIADHLSKKKEGTNKQKEQKEEKSFLQKAVDGFLGMLRGAAVMLLLTPLINKLGDFAQKHIATFLQGFGISNAASGILAKIGVDAFKGAVWGLALTRNPWGVLVGAVGNVLIGQIDNIKKLWNSITESKAVQGIKNVAGLAIDKFKSYVNAYQEGGMVGLLTAVAMDYINNVFNFGNWLKKKIYGFLGWEYNEEEGQKQKETPKKTPEQSLNDYNNTKKYLSQYSPESIQQTYIDPSQQFTPKPTEKIQTIQTFGQSKVGAESDVPLNASISRNKSIPPQIQTNIDNVHNNVVNPLQSAIKQDFGDQHKLIITSSYRDPDYNRSVGGAKNSRHLTGKAMDLQATGLTPNDLVETMQNNGIPFSRAIAEKAGGKQWLHVEYDENAKQQGITASMIEGRYKQNNVTPIQTNKVASNEERNNIQIAQLNSMKATELNNAMDQATPTITNTTSNTPSTPIIYNNNYINDNKNIYPVGDFAQTLAFS